MNRVPAVNSHYDVWYYRKYLKFDVVAGAGACLKLYTGPSSFKVEALSYGMTSTDVQRKKRTRQTKVILWLLQLSAPSSAELMLSPSVSSYSAQLPKLSIYFLQYSFMFLVYMSSRRKGHAGGMEKPPRVVLPTAHVK
ncbi:unnamed protein product [Fraxinus pennsylvanica]|uniref:Uncharacterized protein n=1 Tax=Fraxinus pennsylvanica TaxID=56036 RepID=A0AAD2E338_9LAMI|nr:unnamed protein product [Fraxinus pennsylvanica]